MKTLYFIADLIPAISGEARSERWNGWACPAFERHEADQVVREWNRHYGTFSGVVDSEGEPWKGEGECFEGQVPCAWFNERDQNFYFYCPDIDQTDNFPPRVLPDGRTVWEIGAFGWTWETVSSLAVGG